MRSNSSCTFVYLFLFATNSFFASPLSTFTINTKDKNRGPTKLNIPFQLVGNLLVVQAAINNLNGHFIIDSCVDKLVINSVYFTNIKKLILPSESNGINGPVEDIKLACVKFDWEGIQEKRIAANVLDLSRIEKSTGINIHGFIGYNILKKFEVIFDYQAQILRLYKLDKKGNRVDQPICNNTADHLIKIKMNRHIPVINVKAGDEKLQLGIDSGAATNILSLRSSKKIESSLEFIKEVTLIGFGDKTIVRSVFEANDMEINQLPLGPMKTVVKNIKDFNNVLHFRVDGILGYDFLSQFLVGINFKRKELYLWIPCKLEKENHFYYSRYNHHDIRYYNNAYIQ